MWSEDTISRLSKLCGQGDSVCKRHLFPESFNSRKDSRGMYA